ncbi:MAG: hypothetical protein J7K48_04590 [Thermococcus sp.]|nr:hypothetical protein [Thermococcus sp.]
MPELEFTKTSIDEMCPIAIKLAAKLCSGQRAVTLHDDHTMISVPESVVENAKAKAGNPGTVEELVAFLKEEPWASNWARGMCRVAVGEDSPGFDECVERMLRTLAERMKEEL